MRVSTSTSRSVSGASRSSYAVGSAGSGSAAKWSSSRRVVLGATTASPAMHGPDRAEQVGRGGVLEQERRGAGADRGEGVLVEVEGRQHDHPGRAGPARAAAGSPRRRRPRHPHVHQHDVGGRDRQPLRAPRRRRRPPRRPPCRAGCRRASGSRRAPAAGRRRGRPGSVRLAVGRAHSGSLADTANPPPGAGPASSVPPWTAARSRIPTSPSPRPSARAAAPRPSSRDVMATSRSTATRT